MKDIAIIGVAGRFPDARNIRELYAKLREGHSAAKRLSQERKMKTNLKVHGEYKIFSFLEDVDVFDHKFFKLSKAEAECMDPHQRILLEVVHEMFESAGYNPDFFWGSNTSVYCGDVTLTYYRLAQKYDPTLITGNLNTVTASRISRTYNLRGNNLMVDTNCSSTLVAANLACNDLIYGEADYSIVCGVRLILDPQEEDHKKDDVGIMSFDGKTRSFAADAEGTGAGEAAGCMLLKPLDKAIADGDLIYGVIKAAAVNQEAMLSGSLTAPSSKAQAEVITKAWNKAGIDPLSVTYIEPHGSGTKLGDPIEIQGIDLAYKGLTDEKHFVAVSALKSNIGHTDTMAGLSGLVKVLLSLQNKQLFATTNFGEPNPFIDFANSVTYINTELKPWQRRNDQPLRAGLSSFGLSGTNAHLILEEAPEVKAETENHPSELICLSALTADSLEKYIHRLSSFLEEENPQLSALSRTLNQGRKHFPYRTALLASDLNEFKQQLRELKKANFSHQSGIQKKAILIFPDQSDQLAALTDQLAAIYPSFAAHIATCRKLVSNPDSAAYQAFEAQYALYHLLAQHGISSKNLLGIGVGKLVIDAVLEKRPLAELIAEAEQMAVQDIPDFGKRFQALIDRETETDKVFFIELAVNSTFTKNLKSVKTPDSSDYFEWFGFDHSGNDAMKGLLRSLYLKHFDLNWDLAQLGRGQKTWLPPYAFEATRCWLREPSTADELPEVKPEQAVKTQAETQTKRIIPSDFDSNKVYVDPKWSVTQQKIARFWIEILKLEEISLDDDFFLLGGHSLLATQLINRIEKTWQIRLEFKNITQFSTIRSLAEGVDALIESGTAVQKHPLVKADKKALYPLSKAQYRQWLLQQFDEQSTAYNLPGVMIMKGQVDVQRLEDAFRQLIIRHESLRTCFVIQDGVPMQQVAETIDFSLPFSEIKPEDCSTLVGQFIQAFDLSKAPLFRVELAKYAEGEYLFLFDIHHIISDGVSSDIILRDLAMAYQGFDLEPLEFQYTDFSEWQNQLFASGEMQRMEEFWLNHFSGTLPVLDLPADFARPLIKSQAGDRLFYQLDEKRTAAIRQLAKDSGATVYMTLLALYTTLLHKYTGSEDVITGSPVAGRSREELEHILGMFVNTLAVRNYPKRELDFMTYLDQLKSNVSEVFENQDYPFEELVEKLDIPRDMARNPLFDTMFSYQQFYKQDNSGSGSGSGQALQLEPYGFSNPVSKFDMTWEITETDTQFQFQIEYSTDLFRANTIERMFVHFGRIVDQLISNPKIRLGEISIITPEEKSQIDAWNKTAVAYDFSLTYPQRFKKAAAQFSTRTALVFENHLLSYQEFDHLTDQLAAMLQHQGIGKGAVVAIHTAPGIEMGIAVHAVLKAGACFLPLDHELPSGRIEIILQESEAALMLHDGHLKLEETGTVPTLKIEPEILASSNANFILPGISPDDLAYIIYTSGSTGKPKGVAIPHRGLLNLSLWYVDYYQPTQDDRFLKYSGFGFDASILDFFPCFLTGSALFVVPEDIRKDVPQLHQFMLQHQISIGFLPTAVAEFYLDYENPYLKKLLIGASKYSRYKDCSYVIYDNYGPSENSVIATAIGPVTSEANRFSIGKPITNNELMVVDPQTLQEVPILVKGELLISGDSLAKGYYLQDDLTSAAFIQIEGKRWYRTGDLARWNTAGEIEFFGRIDQQVKISGYRIEPDEITYALDQLPQVEAAYVMAREISGEMALVAYVVGKDFEPELYKTKLRERLPVYMIPAYWVPLENLPLNLNGKVDQQQLPLPELSEVQEKMAPKNADEDMILTIFKEVLRRENIGTDENFFELGGHSLKATQLLANIYQQTGKQVPLRYFFSNATVIGLANWMQGEDAQHSVQHLPKAKPQADYALSTTQFRLHFFQQLSPESIAYNVPGAMRIEGNLDMAALQHACQELINRHASLRTSFRLIGDEIRQVIHENVSPDLSVVSCSEQEVQEEIARFVRPFDLSAPSLLRIQVLDLGKNDHVLLFDVHHIVCDGSSFMILTDEFVRLYKGETLAQPAYQYIDYSEWLQSDAGKKLLEKQKNYWLDQFVEEPTVLNLPTDFSRPEVNDQLGSRIYFDLDEKLLEQINLINQASGSTNFMFFLSVFSLFLSKESQQNDIIVGTPVAGRMNKDLEKVVGMFVNTLVLRNQVNADLSFRELLATVKEHAIGALDHQEFPYEELLENIQVPRNTGRNPLFDVFFVYQNLEQPETGTLDEESRLKSVNFETHVSKFDLTLEIQENHGRLNLIFEYATSLFKKETILRFKEHFIHLLHQVLAHPEIAIGKLKIALPHEEQEILNVFNATHHDFENDKTLQQLFERQAATTPDAIALRFEGESLTYAEVNDRANQLAERLIAAGIVPDDLVMLLLDRSFEMVLAMLAIHKAGGAYMPVDPDVPVERMHYLISDSTTKVVLVNRDYDLAAISAQVFDLRDPQYFAGTAKNPPVAAKPENLAYVIYTSGSTGQPKGTMLEHRGVINRLEWMKTHFQFGERERILQKTAYTFDVSVWEFFDSLCYGHTLVLCRKEVVSDVRALTDIIASEQISLIHFVPSMFKVFLAGIDAADIERLRSLKQIFASGEALPAEYVRQHHKLLAIPLHNLYGPTEASVEVSYFSTSADDTLVPIGKPVWNTQLLVLDQHLNILPMGVGGELHIGGVQLARAYLNKPDLTAEKFIPNPHGEGRLYKTGDLARWMPDGQIEYLGRIDHQVKIRGFRIELGDIESQLLGMGFREVAVIDRTDNSGDKYLCAYIVNDEDLDVTEIRQQLGKNLPDYMIPSYFIRMEAMPLGSSGKLDRKALPEPEMGSTSRYVAPQTEAEKALCLIWQRILGISVVGIQDNFFEIGGHSLKATIMVTNIQKKFGVNLSLLDIFKHPTIHALAAIIAESDQSIYNSIVPVQERPYYPASSAQKRLYVISRINEKGLHYNMPVAYEIFGKLDETQFEKAVHQLVERHESLRTRFALEEDQVVQLIEPAEIVQLQRINCRDEDLESLLNDAVQPFDLLNDPLVRVQLYQTDKGRTVVFFDTHHAQSDGLSLDILSHEFIQLYLGNSLPPLNLHFRDFAVWQQETFHARQYDQLKAFWSDQFKGEVPVLQFPTDFPRPAFQSYDGDSFTVIIPDALVYELRKKSLEAGSTVYMYFMAVMNMVLARYSNQADIIIGTPVAGRPHPDLHQLIGMFVNTLPIRNYPEADLSFRHFLDQLTTNTLRCFDHQEYPLEDMIDLLNLEKDFSRNPIFTVLLSYKHRESLPESNGDETREEPEIGFQPFNVVTQTAKFDFQFDVMDSQDQIAMNVTYCTKLFRLETMQVLTERFLNLLEQVVKEPNKKLGEYSLLEQHEQETLLKRIHQSARSYQLDTTLVNAFREQCQQTPHATALVFEQEKYTYAELDQWSSKLAHYLMREQDVKSGDRVIILQERSQWMIITLLAILKTGAAYVPIDPSYPADRIDFIRKDAAAKTVVDQEQLEAFRKVADQLPVNIENVTISPTDAAYVIYTSGSTGVPKGVLVAHRNVINLICAQTAQFGVTADEHILQFSNIAFDASVEQIFLALLNGAALHVVTHQLLLEPDRFAAYLDEEKITHVHTVPAVLKSIPARKYTNLKRIIAGGDFCPVDLAASWYQHHTFINEYGPTETTVTSIQLMVNESDLERNTLPIGSPVFNNYVYILDDQLNLVPDGVQGEIYIGGEGVTLGYLNRPELNAERFPENPFRKGERFYKTGDLGRYLNNHQIEFLGRNDDQVKIKGFRIELGEIEAALKNHPDINECLVLVKNDANGTAQLAAYYTAGENLSPAELKLQLGKELPAYMIPSYFIPLEVFPLNENGKIKRSALPSPDAAHLVASKFEHPEGATETLLAEIWQQLLGTPQVSRNDSFFDLGGDSIKAIQLSAKLIKAGYKLDLGLFFKQPVLHEAARNLSHKIIDIPQIAAHGIAPLTPIQKRFFEHKLPKSSHFNQALALEGSENLDVDILKEVLHQLVKHHDTLRLRFRQNDQQWEQYYADEATLPDWFEKRFDTGDSEQIAAFYTEIQQGFELHEGGLFRIALAYTPTHTYVLLVAHHLIIDAVSWRILIEDLLEGYRHATEGKKWSPQAKTHSFQYWGEALLKYSKLPQVQGEAAYWKLLVDKQKSDWLGALPDHGRQTEKLSFDLNEDLTDILLRKANKLFACEVNDVLLSPLAVALKDVTGYQEMVIEMEGHGREPIQEELELSRSIGWFTSLFPVLLDASGDDWRSRMYKQRENSRNIPNKGIGYGVLKYLSGVSGLDIQPGILFNYLGQVGSSSGNQTNQQPVSVVPDKNRFTLSGMSTGLNSDRSNTEFPIVLTAIVSGGKLQVELEFEQHAAQAAQMKRLLEAYQNRMTEFLNEVAGMNENEFEDLSGLDALQAMLNRPVFVLRNNERERNLFLCPPAIGFSMVYQDLANELDDFNVYGLNFIADENRMERYVQEMIALNGDQPFVLGGYSGGANLAYQLGTMLEDRGYVVSDLIMLDGMRTYDPKPLSDAELSEKVAQYISEEEGHISHQFLKTKAERNYVKNLVGAYQAYLHATGDFKPISCQIHQILSEQEWEEGTIRKEKWVELTPEGFYLTYQGQGEHGDMLNPGNLEPNAEIFKSILRNVLSDQTIRAEENDQNS